MLDADSQAVLNDVHARTLHLCLSARPPAPAAPPPAPARAAPYVPPTGVPMLTGVPIPHGVHIDSNALLIAAPFPTAP